jgi:hypothetical protein
MFTQYFHSTYIIRGPLIEKGPSNEEWKITAHTKGLEEIRVRLKVESMLYVMETPELVVEPMERISRVEIRLIWQWSSLHEGSIPLNWLGRLCFLKKDGLSLIFTKLCLKSYGTTLVKVRWNFSDEALWISDTLTNL